MTASMKASWRLEHSMPWERELEELRRRRELSTVMGGEASIARQHERGKLTVRERIEGLLDPDSFDEIGALMGRGEYGEGDALSGFVPASSVGGFGRINGRRVVVTGTDFTIRGGSATAPSRKGNLLQELALEFKLPYINLLDGAGANIEGVSERGHSYLPSDYPVFKGPMRIMEQAPLICAVMGSVAGGPAGIALLAHWNVMVKDTSELFASGPPVVKRALGHTLTKQELGGSHIHTRESGCVANEAEDEDDAFRQIRSILSYLPSNVWELPPSAPAADPPDGWQETLTAIVPENRKRPYSMKRLIAACVDRGEFFEIAPNYGEALIVALARVDGQVIGLIANNAAKHGGALDAKAADKQCRFLDLCDVFHIPIAYFVDIPGFMIGEQAERAGTLRNGMRAIWTWQNITVPTFTVQVRKCYGMAGAATSDASKYNYRVAWPSGEFGSIPIEGGVSAAFRKEIESSPDPEARMLELEAELQVMRNVFRTAEAGGVEEVIDPVETRGYLQRFVEMAYVALESDTGKKSRVGFRP